MLTVTEEACTRLLEISKDPSFDGKAVRIRPVGIT
jgi:hypothetical protein